MADVWVVDIDNVAFLMNATDAAAFVAAGGFYGFEYAVAPNIGDEYTLSIFPTSELTRWCSLAGATPTQLVGLSGLPLALLYLRLKGLTSVTALMLTSLGGFSGNTAGGESMLIHGNGFQFANAGTPTVQIDGNDCTSIVVVSDVLITATSPSHAAEDDVDLIVTNAHGSATLAGLDYI